MSVAVSVRDLVVQYRGLKKFTIRSTWMKRKDSKIEIFEALKGVSFDLERGKILGIVGKNGSGKSTLLKAVAGIFSPDAGEVNLHNNTISLMSIGVGFNKKLTGYENIYLSGMLLGFTEKEIAAREKDIIEFASIGDFINKPVRTYSSGMYSKLAFSITAILETDIMLVDEILSVGDQQFREKSYNKMKELIFAENKTVIIVSHNLGTIDELCDEVIWIHNGKIIQQGEPATVLQAYDDFMKGN